MTKVIETRVAAEYPMNTDAKNTWEAAVLARGDVNADLDPTLDHSVKHTTVRPSNDVVQLIVSVRGDVTASAFTSGDAVIQETITADKI